MMARFRVRPAYWYLLVFFAWAWIVNVEGRVLPAAAPMVLVKAVGTNQTNPLKFTDADIDPMGTHTAFWLESARLRPECSYAALDGHLGSRSGQSVPITIAPGPPELRDNGKFSAGPWIANVPIYQFHQTYTDVLHECRYFGLPAMWRTRSRFWN